MNKIAFLLIVFMMLGVGSVMADEMALPDDFVTTRNTDSYLLETSFKKSHGFVEMIVSPYNLMFRPFDEWVNAGYCPTGLVKGVFLGAKDTLEQFFRGAFNFLTAPIPGMMN
ncbi:MAG: hypothetical protein Q8R76_08020 [Candidatus Omnitrophota bacterium]|nr:hypothetical protein [Candidatus Omnitrophota bacterium]